MKRVISKKGQGRKGGEMSEREDVPAKKEEKRYHRHEKSRK